MVAAIQLVFFSVMPGLTDAYALAVALGFMLGAFGQIPINDFMIGKMASGPARARIYGVRYVVSFTVLAVLWAIGFLAVFLLGQALPPVPAAAGPGVQAPARP